MQAKPFQEILKDALSGNIPVETPEYGQLTLNSILNDATNGIVKYSEQERLAMVKLAVIAGADKHLTHSSILVSAIIAQWTSVVKFLLEQPKINVLGIQQNHHIGNSNEDIQTLWTGWEKKEKPAFPTINIQNPYNGSTWAHHYALNNNLDYLKFFILTNPEAYFTIRDFYGYTPIAAALYYSIGNSYDDNTDIITALMDKAGLASTPYPVLRALLNYALNNTNPNKENSIKVIELILEHSHLLLTDADLEAAKGISEELHIKLSNHKASQANWNLNAIIGMEEVEQELEDGIEPNSKYADMLNQYAPLIAPLALNLAFHAIHNIIPVYYTSVAAVGIAYFCKTQQVEMQHAKLYDNTILASAANCLVFAYLNSESSLVQAGSLIGIIAATYQYYQNNKDITAQTNQIG